MSNASPTAVFIQEGKSIDHVASGAVAAGDVVVLDNMIGIAKSPIDDTDTGALSVEGVFSLPKAAVAVTVGQKVYWDSSATQCVVTPASDDYFLGLAVEAAASGDARVKVKINEAVAQPSVEGVGPGYAIARGVSSITGTSTFATGLATVVACGASLGENAALTGNAVSVDPAPGTAGQITVKVWKPTASGDCTPIAATAAKSVNWWAIGTLA